ncbi:hypothetical protein [uncultured Roseobacter sp.]|uniref:hypothetical protein n=1 Tax=uncultured Roseobacter sp. TaxID=114847 RepID=UPI002632D055|nr:hypothetical protein [uncultured Roseobacter sp.]
MKPLYSAMYNALRTTDCNTPISIKEANYEYLILNRPTEQFLTISSAGPAPSLCPACAPKEIREVRTIVATLIFKGSETEHEVFILNQCLPKCPEIRGRFLPAEGTACLHTIEGKPWLKAVGRQACEEHCMADTPTNNDGTVEYHKRTLLFDARPLPWTEEF